MIYNLLIGIINIWKLSVFSGVEVFIFIRPKILTSYKASSQDRWTDRGLSRA